MLIAAAAKTDFASYFARMRTGSIACTLALTIYSSTFKSTSESRLM